MKVEWIPASQAVVDMVPPPVPASTALPDWYKATKPFDGDGRPVIGSGGVSTNITVKMCVPFRDAMAAGYIQKTWCDLNVESADGVRVTDLSRPRRAPFVPELAGVRREPGVPIPPEYYQSELVWIQPWQPKLPAGWSMLLLPALNRMDSPITGGSGIIDSDVFHHTINGKIPFYIRRGFQGIIPAGTGMYQMIPIKREDWTSEAIGYDNRETLRKYAFMHRHFIAGYRRHFAKRKRYL